MSMFKIRPSDSPDHRDIAEIVEFEERELFSAGHHVPTVRALATLMLAICFLVILIYYWLEGKLSFNVPYLLAPILIMVLGLVKSGHAISATRILLWGMLLGAMAGSYWVSGVSTPSLYLLPILTMSAFWLLGRREAVVMFMVATLNVSWQAYIQTHGWVPPISGRSPIYYFLAIVCVMLTGLLLGNAVARNLFAQYLRIKTINQVLENNQARLKHVIAEQENTEAKLKQSEEQLRFVLEGAEQGFWDWDIAAGTVERNKRWAEILGYTYEEIKQTTQQWTDFIYPDDREHAWRSINDVLEGRSLSHKAEYRMLHKDGSVRWILDQASVMQRDEHGLPTRMCGTHTDITDRKHSEAVIRESNLQLKRILDNLFAYVALLDTNGVVQEVNNAPLARAGYRREDVVGQYFYDAPWWSYNEEVRKQLMEAINAAQRGEKSRYDVIVKMGDDYVPIDFQITPVLDNTGHIIGLLPTAVDITERKHLEDELNRQAHLDYLTGLPNRRSFMEQAEVELSRTLRYENTLSFLMLDIDNFKQINDAYGHQAGDLVLKKLAMIFQEVLRNIDITGRLGGEEFAVILPETNIEKASEVAERLREVISLTAVSLPAGFDIHFTVSIGISALLEKKTNVEALLNEADKALYKAKQSGRNKVVIA